MKTRMLEEVATTMVRRTEKIEQNGAELIVRMRTDVGTTVAFTVRFHSVADANLWQIHLQKQQDKELDDARAEINQWIDCVRARNAIISSMGQKIAGMQRHINRLKKKKG
jgi:hypothetical protein